MNLDHFRVTKAAMRPASTAVECFYCNAPVGEFHKPECVLIQKKVKVRLTIDYEIAVPNSWNKDTIEYHRNNSTWCADNLIGELQTLADEKTCLCSAELNYKYIDSASKPYCEEE